MHSTGYQYKDSTIVGFSHTRLSGTGHSDLGDILIMPFTGLLQTNPERKVIRTVDIAPDTVTRLRSLVRVIMR